MKDFTHWTESQIDEFSHHISDALQGSIITPNATEIGFVLVVFPMTAEANLRMLSNQPEHIVSTVLQQVLASVGGLTDG